MRWPSDEAEKQKQSEEKLDRLIFDKKNNPFVIEYCQILMSYQKFGSIFAKEFGRSDWELAKGKN